MYSLSGGHFQEVYYEPSAGAAAWMDTVCQITKGVLTTENAV